MSLRDFNVVDITTWLEIDPDYETNWSLGHTQTEWT